ncbi:HAD-IIA family hydrolase [bacterium]|nr:MAG: HAD-IIA family hydrolase [bacterium]
MIRAYLFDLDGTLFRGSVAIPGAAEAVNALRARGAAIRFLTNNSTRTRDEFAAKLRGFGYVAEDREVYSTAAGTAFHLNESGLKSAFVVGEIGLKATLAESGIAVVEEGPADAVVVGLARNFSYDMLKEAMERIRAGAAFVATNPDKTYPVEGGGLIPGAGSIVAAVRACSGVEPFIVGKPNPFLVRAAVAELRLNPEEVLVVGDRLDTDIEAGKAAGCPTWLVLSGVEPALPDGQPGSADVTGLL